MSKREKRKRLGFKTLDSKRVFVSPTIMGSSRLFSSAWLLSGRSHAQVFFVLLPTSCPAGHFSEEGARSLAEISHFLKGKKSRARAAAIDPTNEDERTYGKSRKLWESRRCCVVRQFLPSFLPSSEASWHQWRERERKRLFFSILFARFSGKSAAAGWLFRRRRPNWLVLPPYRFSDCSHEIFLLLFILRFPDFSRFKEKGWRIVSFFLNFEKNPLQRHANGSKK